MKKILPYIFLVLIVVNLFAPLSLALTTKGVGIERKEAEASPNCKFEYAAFDPVGLQSKPAILTLTIGTKDCIGERVLIQLFEIDNLVDNSVFDSPARNITANEMLVNFVPGEKNCGDGPCIIGFKISLLSQVTGQVFVQDVGMEDVFTEYGDYSSVEAERITYPCSGNTCSGSEWKEQQGNGVAQNEQQVTAVSEAQKKYEAAKLAAEAACKEYQENPDDADLEKKCKDAEQALKEAEEELNNAQNNVGPKKSAVDSLPKCGLGIFDNSSIMGCVVKVTYYVFFVPTSYLFALAGMFFDNTFAYSVQDTSYRSPFVVEGWGIVRDFCNMFFIFVLLYIAFSTILNIHGFKTKEMVVNVVIIGLLINFSLFAAQLVVDSSNILARVFYNSSAINIDIIKNGNDGWTSGGIYLYDTGEEDQIQLSAAIVGKINPAVIITEANKPSIIQEGTDGKQTEIGTGTWFLVTILAIIINVVGIAVFLSVGLVFIARVIGIWIYMIMAPLAFFSYTVPKMQGIDMIGWKKWWPELLSMSFLAPIFIFFLYLILRFIETGLGLLDTSKKDGLAFVIAVIVPFAFIMILMTKAKKIAQKMSGEFGQGIVGGIAAASALTLGAGAIGAKVLGKRLIGGTMGMVSRGDTATQKYEAAQQHAKMTGDKSMLNKLSWHQRTRGAVGSFAGLGKIYGRTDGKYDPVTRQKNMTIKSGLGGFFNEKQKSVGEIDHARHEMDTIKEKAGLKGVADSKLSGVNEQKLKETYAKEKKSVVEAELKNTIITKDANGNDVVGADGYKAANRNRITQIVGQDQNNVDYATGDLTDAAKKKVENELNVEFNAVLKTATEKKLAGDYDHLREESRTSVNPVSRIVATSNTGSYDVRDLSKTRADKRESLFTRASAGLIAGIAMGVRTGLKSMSINHGSGQSDFLKDIGHTITEALKSTKVKVKVEESHAKGGDDHGGGGGHH
ncbi:MAG: hypothetical protein V4665_02450 [Patescibacteria group bacterium]